jgi:hypothetical protein
MSAREASGSVRKKRIGHITPSSNTILEPLTYAMNRGWDDRSFQAFVEDAQVSTASTPGRLEVRRDAYIGQMIVYRVDATGSRCAIAN